MGETGVAGFLDLDGVVGAEAEAEGELRRDIGPSIKTSDSFASSWFIW